MKRAIEFAWRVHGAQASWANSADSKASMLLVLEGGALYAVIAALGPGGSFAGQSHLVAYVVGVALLVLANGAAAAAVFPRLGPSGPRPERRHQAIYFGDLRGWDGADLAGHVSLLTQRAELDLLTRQLAEMSARNWVKYRWVQASFILLLAAFIEIICAILIAR